MIRSISVLLLLLLAFPAAATPDTLHVKAAFAFAHRKMWSAAIGEAHEAGSPILARYFTWQSLKDPESNAPFEDISDFMEKYPSWPDQATLQKRAEVALLSGNPSDEALGEWFRKHPPHTEQALRKSARTAEELHALIREAWVKDDYDKETEAKLFAKYHSILRAEDHIRRIDRLLWENHIDEAKRLVKYVPYNHQRLFQARISLSEDKQRAPIDVVNVPPQLNSDEGLLFERIKWRIRRGDKDGVRELLLAAPAEVPYPEKWWPLRDRQVREALGENDVKLAQQLMARHGQKAGSLSYKEAQWLEAWMDLEYLNSPAKAYALFTGQFRESQTPAGKARIAYWAARAAQNAHKGDASHWFSEAADYPTTFYGQLARWELDHDAQIRIHSDVEPTAEEKRRFRKREIVQLVLALGEAHETDEAGKFILYLVDDAESPGEAILATRLGGEIRRIDYNVRAAKKALNSDIVSLESGWPVIALDNAQGIEKSLLLALVRQESEFFADAISSSGALGLMQLLPSTAKEIARKNSLSFAADRLFDPGYNLTVGSLYLAKMIDKFSGSYVLATASYNAGPGRIGQWLHLYGHPGGSVHDTLDWIERIPTTETRNYVQHVIANMEVYRFMLAGRTPTKLMIAEDLVR